MEIEIGENLTNLILGWGEIIITVFLLYGCYKILCHYEPNNN